VIHRDLANYLVFRHVVDLTGATTVKMRRMRQTFMKTMMGGGMGFVPR
jgi:hypothetical protein